MAPINRLMQITLTLAAAAGALGLAAVAASPSKSAARGARLMSAEKMRIGIYDTRAIAVAWAASKYSPVRGKMAEMEAAKKAGDQRLIRELQEWGLSHQRLAHFQGFSRVPVGELLEPVRERVADVARRQHLAAITMECDHVEPSVELVDVTDALVALYEPSPRTLSIVRSLKNTKPIGLVEAADIKVTD